MEKGSSSEENSDGESARSSRRSRIRDSLPRFFTIVRRRSFNTRGRDSSAQSQFPTDSPYQRLHEGVSDNTPGPSLQPPPIAPPPSPAGSSQMTRSPASEEVAERPAEDKDTPEDVLGEEEIWAGDFNLFRYVRERDAAEVQNCCEEFKYLHVPGKPVFVVHVHDFATAAIAAEEPAVQALCVDIPTIRSVLGRQTAGRDEWLATTGHYFITEISLIAQRVGKLLVVDMGSREAHTLLDMLPACLAAGVVGFDLRDSNEEGYFTGEYDMATRIRLVKNMAALCKVPDFVVNAAMTWPGDVDAAIARANRYLDAGATVVTVLSRLPGTDFGDGPGEYSRMLLGIQGRVGAVLEMPFAGLARSAAGTPTKYSRARAFSAERAPVARLSYGNQWPHLIRTAFQRCVKLQFGSD